MDPSEEEYFNTSDEEDNVPAKESTLKPVNGGAPSPCLKQLVDYPDDDAMDVVGDEAAVKKAGESEGESAELQKGDVTSKPTQQPLLSGTASPSTSPSPSTPKSVEEPLSNAPTPERLAEKRRREEEDDDELGKLSKNKRRSPTSGGGVGLGQVGLSRKRSFGSSGSPPSKKIAINLAVKTTTTATAAGEGAGETGKEA